MKKYVYFYLMKNKPEKIGEIVPSHISYWKDNKPENYSGGPFADRTGGLILFDASSLEEATNIIKRDPFIIHDVIEMKWIKEWVPE